MNGPYLGIDIGLKRTGISLSESGLQARPLIVIESAYPHLDPLYTGLMRLYEKYQPTTLVIGQPNHLDGTTSRQTDRIAEIVKEISENLPSAEIVLWDEHGTTKEAKRLYPTLDDNLGAATLILQDYLNTL